MFILLMAVSVHEMNANANGDDNVEVQSHQYVLWMQLRVSYW